jgi:hypothetical protein
MTSKVLFRCSKAQLVQEMLHLPCLCFSIQKRVLLMETAVDLMRNDSRLWKKYIAQMLWVKLCAFLPHVFTKEQDIDYTQ